MSLKHSSTRHCMFLKVPVINRTSGITARISHLKLSSNVFNLRCFLMYAHQIYVAPYAAEVKYCVFRGFQEIIRFVKYDLNKAMPVTLFLKTEKIPFHHFLWKPYFNTLYSKYFSNFHLYFLDLKWKFSRNILRNSFPRLYL